MNSDNNEKDEDLDFLEENNSDNEIEAPVIKAVKPKRVLNEKQREGFEKGRKIAHARSFTKDYKLTKKEIKDNLKKEKEEIMIKNMNDLIAKSRKQMEDKIIKLAVSLKKNQLAEEKRLAEYTKNIDLNIPDEHIKEIIREKKIAKSEPVSEPVKPNPFEKYYFL